MSRQQQAQAESPPQTYPRLAREEPTTNFQRNQKQCYPPQDTHATAFAELPAPGDALANVSVGISCALDGYQCRGYKSVESTKLFS